jgi:hypothetical protein
MVTYVFSFLCLVYIKRNALLGDAPCGVFLFRMGSANQSQRTPTCELMRSMSVKLKCITSNLFNKVTMAPKEHSEQIVSFLHNDDAWALTTESIMDSTRSYGETTDATLAEFLGRPVKIASPAWTTAAGSLTSTLNPWKLFLENTHVRNRVEGYRLLQGKMNIRITINGNPFLYGRAIAAYDPRPNYDEFFKSTDPILELARLSMLPHLFLDPSSSEGGSMTLPFFHPDNWIDLIGQTADSMGTFTIQSINDLLHANSPSGEAQITVFAWMSEVKLCGPTQNAYAAYDAQSGSEYGTGIISKPASVLAKAAGYLSHVPVIGSYARATEMVASSIGRVAAIFGYSRPPILSDIARHKIMGMGIMAHTDEHEAVVKLTLDSKQELSIDPRTVGLGSIDEMTVAYIAQREMFIGTRNWSEATPVDGLLRIINVNPIQHVFNAQLAPILDELQLAPMATVAVPFQYWRGSMKIRFQIVASAMHRGRLKISYDPWFGDETAGYNEEYSRIIDLAGNRDFEFNIGWNAAKSWLLVDNDVLATPTTNHNNADLQHDKHNGQVRVSVLNKLTSPDPTLGGAVYINMFVSAGPDFEVASPTDQYLGQLEYYPQSGEELIAETDDIPESPAGIAPVGDLQEDAKSNCVHMGEAVLSVRALLKRYCYHSVLANEAPGNWHAEYNFPSYGGQRGFVNRHTTGDLTPYNYTSMTYLNWFTPCYAGWRGGLRSKYVTTNAGTKIFVRRDKPRIVAALVTEALVVPTNDSERAEYFQRLLGPGSAGSHAVNTSLDGALEVEFPFQSYKRFAPGRLDIYQDTQIDAGSSDMHIVTVLAAPGVNDMDGLVRYVAAGDDYSSFFWLGQPVLGLRDPPTSGGATKFPPI